MAKHPTPWQNRAACAGMAPMFDADTYFATPYYKKLGAENSARNLLIRLHSERKHYKMQLQTCANCPVRRQCAKAAVAYEQPARRKAPWDHTSCVCGVYVPTERLLWHINAAYSDDEPLGQLARYALKQLTPHKKKDTK